MAIVPLCFSAAQPISDSVGFNELMLYAHLAQDAYAGAGQKANTSLNLPPFGWTRLATEQDLLVARPGSLQAAPNFQATAYQAPDGAIVIAYRGTDDTDELLNTSIPLGAGLNQNGTQAYLQATWDFYDLVRELPATEGADVSFTGHSLGGIVAGYMSAVTGKRAIAFASGPHNEIFENGLDALVDRDRDGVNGLALPFYNNIINLRVDGEILQEAIELAKTGAAIQALFSPLGSPLSTGTITALLIWGNASRRGEFLGELDAGSEFGIIDTITLHKMQLHFLLYFADILLGLDSDYKETAGFLRSFVDEDFAKAVDPRFDITSGLSTGSAQLFADIVLSAAGRAAGGADVLEPLLRDIDENVHLAMDAAYGLSESLRADARDVATYLSEIAVEHAALAASPLAGERPYGNIMNLESGGEWLTVDLNAAVFGGERASSSTFDRIPYGLYETISGENGPEERGLLARVTDIYRYDVIRDVGLEAQFLSVYVGSGLSDSSITGGPAPTFFFGGAGNDDRYPFFKTLLLRTSS